MTELENSYGAVSDETAAELERIISDRRQCRSIVRRDCVRRIAAELE